MAKNTGQAFRRGAVRSRSQTKSPSGWVKRSAKTGRFMDKRSDAKPFKRVTKEK